MNEMNGITKFSIRYTIYCASMSSIAGVSNAVGDINEPTKYLDLFCEGFTNHIPFGLAINLIYPLTLPYFRKTNHYRLYSNLLTFGAIAVMYVLHSVSGTQNPEELVAVNGVVALTLVNADVSLTKKKNLEERLKN